MLMMTILTENIDDINWSNLTWADLAFSIWWAIPINLFIWIIIQDITYYQ